jgi:hypothetical protein
MLATSNNSDSTMTKYEEIIYTNAIDTIGDYAERMKSMVQKALDNKVIDTTNRNPMFIALSNDFVAGALRWAIMNLKPFVESKEDAIKISEAMWNNFRTEPIELNDLSEGIK